MIIPLFWVKDIFLAMGYDDKVATMATTYVHTVSPGLYFYFQSIANMAFAGGQKIVYCSMITTPIAVLVHIFFTWLFVGQWDWGFEGVCYATMVHFMSRWVGSTIFLMVHPKFQDTRSEPFFSRETVSQLGDQTKLNLANVGMGVWGWWSFDIFTLLAGQLSTEAISAQTILRSLGLLTFMIPLGFSSANGILVGMAIGSGKEGSLKFYYKTVMTMSLFVAALQIVLLWSAESAIQGAFTDDVDVVAQMAKAWPVLLIFVFFDTT